MIWFPTFLDLTSPLWKIPALLPASRLAILALTPPTQSVQRDEIDKYGEKKDLLGTTAVRVGSVIAYKIIFNGYFLCESAAILAQRLHSPISEDILALVGGCRAENIKITPLWLIGCISLTCGSALRLACFRAMGKFFTWELAVKKDHTLITHGPYSIVRHPSYLGGLLLETGTLLCHFGPGSWYRECIAWDTWASRLFTAAWGGWCVLVAMSLMRRASIEDKIMRKEFGEQWEAWARQTPYKVIPYIW